MSSHKNVPLPGPEELPLETMIRRAAWFRTMLATRRSMRHFSEREIPPAVLEECLKTGLSAPSGANRQPWHFVVVLDPSMKKEIRERAEREERDFYTATISDEWREALDPLGTNPSKPFLEEAPALIAIFEERYRGEGVNAKRHNYYTRESVGIATGFLIAALHHAGLACLTYTPSRMVFLRDLLKRPRGERPFLLLVTGYPAADARVPAIERRPYEESVTLL